VGPDLDRLPGPLGQEIGRDQAAHALAVIWHHDRPPADRGHAGLRAGAYGRLGGGLRRGGVGPRPAGQRDRPGPAGAACNPGATSRTSRCAGTGNGDPAAAGQLRLACLMPGAKLRTRGSVTVAGSSIRSGNQCLTRERRASCLPVALMASRSSALRAGAVRRCHAACSSRRSSRCRCPRLRADARARDRTGRSPGRSLKVTTVTTTATAGRSRCSARLWCTDCLRWSPPITAFRAPASRGACAWPAGPGMARDLSLCRGFGVQAILQRMRWRLLAVAAGLAAYGMLVRPCAAGRGGLRGRPGQACPVTAVPPGSSATTRGSITFSSSPGQGWPRLVQAGDGRAVAGGHGDRWGGCLPQPERYPAGRPWRRGQRAGGRRLAACTRADPGGGAAR
jgi:hypothetical protein